MSKDNFLPEPFNPINPNKALVSPQDVNRFHQQSDVDTGDFATHHTLGFGEGQAAPGVSVYKRLKLPYWQGTLTTVNLATTAVTDLAWAANSDTRYPNSTEYTLGGGGVELTVTQQGLYLVSVGIINQTGGGVVQRSFVSIMTKDAGGAYVDGARGGAPVLPAQFQELSHSAPVALNAGGTIKIQAYQQSGVNSVMAAPNYLRVVLMSRFA